MVCCALCFEALIIVQCVCYTLALHRDDPEVDRIITRYWLQYKKIAVILAYLKIVHQVAVGMTWLKRRIHDLGLHRRGVHVNYSPLPDVQRAVEQEQKEGNNNIGYRQMWIMMKQRYNLIVKRSTVQMLMSVVDPDGAQRRRARRLKRRVYQNKGPDFVWHMDGYDKLKPYGFCIHACIDGYSRRIIWLQLASTNNDPRVILLYYLMATLQCNGCPTILRSDCGTENTEIAACQMAIRHGHSDEFSGERSFRYGSSTTNTRIESWWTQLRNSVTDWWINLFKDFIQKGSFNPQNQIHRHCLSYVYVPLLENALYQFKMRWNTHQIRPNRLAGCPPGAPDDLYHLPQLTGTSSYKKALNFDVWSHCFLTRAYRAPPFFPPEFDEAATAILHTLNVSRQDIILTVHKQYTTILSIL